MSKLWDTLKQKLNPAQPEIVNDFGETDEPSSNLLNNQRAYNELEVVNRGVNLIVDSAAGIALDIGEMLDFFGSPTRIRNKKLHTLLNYKPNPFYNADLFKRNIIMDLILEGDAFIYFDGAYLYNLPALSVKVVADKKTYIKQFEYNNKIFSPEEIIHIKENAGDTIYTGRSRLDAAKKTIALLLSMNQFQQTFFDNSAIPGLVLITPNPLSERVKNRMIYQWMTKYNPKSGGRRPMILDGDFKLESLAKYNFKELDFVESITSKENKILHALGVPPILLDSGNNANITPNLKLFYVTTVLPLVNKVTQSLELYFGYDIKPVTQDVLALRPELKDLADFHTAMVNAGILTRNESRAELRYPESDDEIADKLYLPANIAGSAQDPSQGGKPKEDKMNE